MHESNAIRRAFGAAIIGVVIAGGVRTICAQGKARPQEQAAKAPVPKPVAAQIDAVQVGGDLTITLLDQVTLAFDRPGIVSMIAPREGDQVEEGQLIAWLQDEVPKATLAIAAEEAESDVDIRYAEKAGEVSDAEHQKALETNRRFHDTVTEVEIERLRLAAEKSILEKESAEHRQAVNCLKRDEAQVQLDTFRIKAPFSGVVTRVHRKKGEAVRQGDQVLELVNTDKVRIDGVIHIRDMLRVKPGDEVTVYLDNPDIELEIEKRSFPGHIRFVDVKVEPVEQKVRIWAEVDNPDNILRAGLQHARMTIHPNSKPPAKD
ncbi:MAG: efflux RND transporter periplasmic adaptor subunit [Planctomycetaceae bacterium]|nr:efflux RND transporter periplasmic adaptor subunit [Planctomycetaceae bacterium]